MASRKLSDPLCYSIYCNRRDTSPKLHRPPVLPPPRPPRRHMEDTKHVIDIGTSVLAIAFVMATLIFVFCAVIKCYFARKRLRSGRRSWPLETYEDFYGEEHGAPELDHPIWYINTVGLHQSIIDSITVFKYKKNEVLVEGTDCSVCLSEFEEDENLRLLPKCSHAFHIHCIDAWLRSHTNCPLCRSPIISSTSDNGASSSVEINSRDSNSFTEDSEMVNSETYVELVSGNAVGAGTSRSDAGDMNSGRLPCEGQVFDKIPTNNELRALSNLGENRQVLKEEIQPVRRSVSLDFHSASAVYGLAATNSGNEDGERSDRRRGKVRNVNGSSSASRLTKSSSIGCLLQKGPKAFKRSSSLGGKILSSMRWRSHDLKLPL